MDGGLVMAELRITHRTRIVYDAPVRAAYHEARLTPLSDAGQVLLHPHLTVEPQPWSTTYRDYWGATVTAFEVLHPHESVTVTATSTVRTSPTRDGGSGLTWTELADPALSEELAEFLIVTERVRPPAEVAARAREAVASGATPAEVVRDAVGVADTSIVVGTLRLLGLPARYVSGYLVPELAVGETAPGAVCSWAEWWDGAWQRIAPLPDTAPARLVARAIGRDEGDVAALRALFTGEATSTMSVEVEIQRVG